MKIRITVVAAMFLIIICKDIQKNQNNQRICRSRLIEFNQILEEVLLGYIDVKNITPHILVSVEQ
jgi:hypothetical protein